MQDVGGPSLTCADTWHGVLRWAGALRRLGVDAGDTVLTMLPTTTAGYLPWLGASLLRAIEVPVNTAYRGRMLSYVVGHSRATVAVVHASFLDRLAEVVDDLGSLETVIVVGAPTALGAITVLAAEDLLDGPIDEGDVADPQPHDTCCIIYTSGTTGPSKGVLMPWRELYELQAAQPASAFDAGRGLYSAFPFFHVSGKQAIWAAARNRARLVLRETFSPGAFWDDIERHDCTSTGLLGTMATMLLRAEAGPRERGRPLRHTQMGPVIAELEEFRARFGVEVSTGYGMSEIGWVLQSPDHGITDHRSSGRPRPGYHLRIVDDHDHDVPVGAVGELVVRTDEPWMMCAGYWDMPEATAAAWRNGWFHTGDGFRADADGNFYFVDRLKDTLRRRGENISSFEVESLVLDHPDVLECAAVAVPSELTEDDLKIVVVLRPGAPPAPEALHAALREAMPRFMVPRYIEIVDELPKTPTLRVKKAELRAAGVGPRTWDAHAQRLDGEG
jgi:crotonobetaine/carnitine-CoA ligase